MIIAVILVVIDLTRIKSKCDTTKIIYRYIPRNLAEEMESPVYTTDILKALFKQPSPWLLQMDNKLLDEADRKYYISQI